MDLYREDLGLTEKQRAELTSNLNLIINCVGNLDFEARLDVSVRVNVQGSLQLLQLGEESPAFEAFCHVSSTFVNCDRTGFLEERLYESPHDWAAEYSQILGMSQRDLKSNEKRILAKFPNSVCYSKRMAEHMLVLRNSAHKKLPLVFVRPSIVGTAANEPMPGWTDSMGLI